MYQTHCTVLIYIKLLVFSFNFGFERAPLRPGISSPLIALGGQTKITGLRDAQRGASGVAT